MDETLVRKLRILADAAKYDASCASSGGKKRDSRGTGGIGSTDGGMGICHSYTPGGRCVSLRRSRPEICTGWPAPVTGGVTVTSSAT